MSECAAQVNEWYNAFPAARKSRPKQLKVNSPHISHPTPPCYNVSMRSIQERDVGKMELLKQKILECGRALDEHVLLVDAFLNHQVDVKLMREIGREFAARFADAGVTRVVTIESSGIAPAAMTALELDVPMVILKKSASSILKDDILQTEVFSFTKNAPYMLTLKPRFIAKGDRVLLIDDFLANGEAALGASDLLHRAGAEVAGIGIVIAKTFQPGLKKLRAAGHRVEVLAPVKRMAANVIEFGEAE